LISLPPGCEINYEVTIIVHDVDNEEFIQWWQEVGGEVIYKVDYDRKGREITIPVLRYGQGRQSHKSAGNPEYLIRFKPEDAGVALMMLMKFDKLVISHNMREVDRMKEAHYGY